MLISLDQAEVSAILINWAKGKYKTHNVAVEKYNRKSRSFVSLEITLPEDKISEQQTYENKNIFLGELKQRVEMARLDDPTNFNPILPDYTPNFEGATEGLI